eukprot:4289866-Karenia_brevis.AAC.1
MAAFRKKHSNNDHLRNAPAASKALKTKALPSPQPTPKEPKPSYTPPSAPVPPPASEPQFIEDSSPSPIKAQVNTCKMPELQATRKWSWVPSKILRRGAMSSVVRAC